MKLTLSLVTIGTLILLSGCTKVTQTSTGDPVPVIRFISLSKDTIHQFADSMSLTFSYEDGDGDLGFENADINSLEVKDSRLQNPDFYYVKPLAPIGSKVSIKGQLSLRIKNLFLIGSGGVEQTTLQLRLKDRAGNWSNIVITPTISILK